jgi:hypothetical protein
MSIRFLVEDLLEVQGNDRFGLWRRHEMLVPEDDDRGYDAPEIAKNIDFDAFSSLLVSNVICSFPLGITAGSGKTIGIPAFRPGGSRLEFSL